MISISKVRNHSYSNELFLTQYSEHERTQTVLVCQHLKPLAKMEFTSNNSRQLSSSELSPQSSKPSQANILLMHRLLLHWNSEESQALYSAKKHPEGDINKLKPQD